MSTKIKPSKLSVSVKNLKGRFEKINFDLAIQRNEVWDDGRKSLLIHSLLYGYPIPAVYARKLDNSDIDHMLDGKQRLMAIFGYVKQGDFVKDAKGNKIPLVSKGENGEVLYETWPGFELKNVQPVTYVDDANDTEVTIDVNGMKFLDLPEHLRDELLGQMISITRFENMTDEEQDEMFMRLNNGMPLRNMELTRAYAGSSLMNFVEEISAMKFFAESVAITEKGRNRFVDDESVLQALSLVYYAGTDTVPGFSGGEMKTFVELLRDQGGLPDEKATLVREITNYLGLAFPYKESSLKKVHIPSLFLVAIEATKRGITPEKFGGYWQEFFAKRYKVGTVYGVASSSGSAKKDKIAIRVHEMFKDFEAHIGDAPDYTEPKKVQNAKAAEEARKQAELAAQKAAEEAARVALVSDNGAENKELVSA